MEYVVIALAALAASALTLFSGFGLGTLLMPVFALFFPVSLAIAATAVVHLANNLFKLFLVGRRADLRVVLRFGVPAALAAAAGAAALVVFDGLPSIGSWSWQGQAFTITWLKLAVGLLIVGFALLESWPRFESLAFDPKWLPAGGLMSGLFGGLSGHQGAFRSAFLIRSGLDKDAFVGTSVVCSVVVDCVRLVVYGFALGELPGLASVQGLGAPVAVAVASAFLGAYAGTRLLAKVTLRFVQRVVAAMLLGVGIALVLGLV